MIKEEQVLNFQKEWGDGIINIGKTFLNNGDYVNEAKLFINKLYAYSFESVLFKPTLAYNSQFRLDKISALSYFVGGNSNFSEDSGFAIKGWTKIRWENAGIKILDNCAIAMGNYFFMDKNNNELMVEFSIVLKNINGKLMLILHDSHLPYQSK